MLLKRPRRNRKTAAIRSLVQEARLHPSQLVMPIFVKEMSEIKEPISSLPFQYRFNLLGVLKECEKLSLLGLSAIALFPVIEKSKKIVDGKEALNEENVLIKAIREIKNHFPDICLIADVALDPYTDHGHDGILNDRGDVDNDATVEILVKQSVMLASAGVDIVAPSDMMDGRVGRIREALESFGFTDVNILSYAVKYASSFYAPFREAVGSPLKVGNKRTYQMDPANSREALREVLLDEAEGADIVMVKPALAYLDVITKVKEITPLPVAAFHVSGEYAALYAAAERGWLDAEAALLESLLSIKRAGADMIFTYGAMQAAKLLG